LFLFVMMAAVLLALRRICLAWDALLFGTYLAPLVFAILCSGVTAYELRRQSRWPAVQAGAAVGLVSAGLAMGLFALEFLSSTRLGQVGLLLLPLLQALVSESLFAGLAGGAVAAAVHTCLHEPPLTACPAEHRREQ
jgi:high-affinity Fe2+/Pb2+ permease